jgi:tetratricopeptide (TPR) repeat protein
LRQKDTIEHRLRKAEIFIEKGQYRNAVKIYEKIIEMCSENADVWNNFGIALEGVGRYEDAVVAYERAIAIKPSIAWFWSNKGNALDELGRY